MSNDFRRLAWPLFLSIICMVLVHWWHLGEAKKFKEVRNEGATKIAYLLHGTEGVERRPTSRLIWNKAEQGTLFYTGDIVRTSDLANGTVSLFESGVEIRLEPESVVILEKSENSSTVNLLSGALFVDAKNRKSAKNNTKIKSGSTEISLDKSDVQMSLAKNNDASLNMTVANGEVKVGVGGKSQNISQGESGTIANNGGFSDDGVVQVVSPAPGASINLNSTRGRVTFKWKPLANSTKVVLWKGDTKSTLKPLSKGVDGNIGSLNVEIPEGEFYWQLQANGHNSQLQSFIYHASAVEFRAPKISSPKVNQQFSLAGDRSVNVSFSWSQIRQLKTVKIEVARDKDFKDVLFSKQLVDTLDFQTPISSPGRYFVRVIGYFPNTAKGIVAPAVPFEIKKSIKIAPPKLLEPLRNVKLTYQNVKKSGVVFAWENVESAIAYAVKIQRGANVLLEKVVRDTIFKFDDVKPGEYQWSVQSIGGEERRSVSSSKSSFSIQNIGSIAWLVSSENPIKYRGKPLAQLKWSRGSSRSWKYRYSQNLDQIARARWNMSSRPSVKIKLDLPGSYYFEVVGLSEKKEVVAISKKLKLVFEEDPELPKVVLLSPSHVKADQDRSFEIDWKRVSGAARYVIKGVHSNPMNSVSYNTTKTRHRFTNLYPGRYLFSVTAIDKKAREGKQGRGIIVTVPNRSTIAAPDSSLIKVSK